MPPLKTEEIEDGAAALELLRHGRLTVEGRLRDASNATLYCAVEHEGRSAHAVYKPVAGERPLWDFPDGTLARRETAARVVSEATGWGLVPPTVLREEGPYGEGMVQLWIDEPGEPEGPESPDGAAEPAEGTRLLALYEGEDPAGIEAGWLPVAPADLGDGKPGWLLHADDPRLRRLAVLDAVINNADRKGGHLLQGAGGRLFAVDHGVTFAVEDKLRTLLWGWAGRPLADEHVAVLRRLTADGELAGRLGELLAAEEVAAFRGRVARLLDTGVHPEPSGEWPSIPWPPI
nr:SCO1664 family protein [Mangrovactinospora gilvigrisea]